MRHEHLRRFLIAVLLAFLTAWGSIGCLITAFDLNLQHPAAPILVCALSAAAAGLLLCLHRGGTILLCLGALAAGYIHRSGAALEQLRSLISHLSPIYDRASGWGILTFSSEMAQYADWPLCIWGTILASLVCRSICRQASVWPPVLMSVLPLCTCIVVTDTVPKEPFLLMVMAALILLILPASVRQENATQADRLTAAAFLPVILSLAGLFLLLPQKGYVNHSEVLRQNILTAAQNIPQLISTGGQELVSGIRRQPPRQVDLSTLGDRITFTYPVMEVTAQESGTLYLRGQSYDVYDGLSWSAGEASAEVFSGLSGPEETIRIETRSPRDILYLPYHPKEETTLSGGFAQNPNSDRAYQIRRVRLPEDWRQTAYGGPATTPEELEPYLKLPETARQSCADFLADLDPENSSHAQLADLIAARVTDSAQYHTRPQKMPAGEADFAAWFLRDGTSGYCVHFATAATVLLRSAGIPARYVTGYMLEAQAGEPVLVTEENAHAWAEYYEPNLGLWLPLEATPSSQILPQTSPRPVIATESTETALPTEPPLQEPETATESVPEMQPEPETVLPPEAPPTHLGWTLLILPGAIGFLLLQRSCRLFLRRRARRTGTSNQQALRRWQEALRLARLLKESPTEELIVLAQKAKFSQHELTQEELQQFDSFSRSCLRRLREKPLYLQMIYKYVYAVF